MHLKKIYFFASLITALSGISTQAAAEQEAVDPDDAAIPERVAQTESPSLGINSGMVYQSKYYWRGQWFYGAAAGVFLPYVSYTQNNFYYYLGGEIGENLVFDSAESNESGFGSVEKDWTGIDYGFVYTTDLSKKVGLSLGAWYFWYFRSRDINNDNIDNSFFDLRVSITLKEIFLNPTLSYSHYLRVDSDYAKRTKEDFYLTLGLTHQVPFTPSATLLLGANLNYWHYASKEESDLYGQTGKIPAGISDAVLKTGISVSNGQMTFSNHFNYGHVFHEKFDYTSGKAFDRNKFWTTFSVDYAL
jgi:hypothetical protein